MFLVSSGKEFVKRKRRVVKLDGISFGPSTSINTTDNKNKRKKVFYICYQRMHS